VVRSHADDLELARRCASGSPEAWDRFVLEYRPVLYRAADALDRHGGAREVADSLYAELFGLRSADGERQSLFRYFQGRSSLATWLRAVLAQRLVDRARAQRRLEPLPPEAPDGDNRDVAAPLTVTHPEPVRGGHAELVQQVLALAIAALTAPDRLRLACYYARGMTLAETGRVMQEYEATVSRQLKRTRGAIRQDVERRLKESGMTAAAIRECLASAAADPGPLDLQPMLRDSGAAEHGGGHTL
jgi:RNA polymerase sigma factor (sigma-70 family)